MAPASIAVCSKPGAPELVSNSNGLAEPPARAALTMCWGPDAGSGGHRRARRVERSSSECGLILVSILRISPTEAEWGPRLGLAQRAIHAIGGQIAVRNQSGSARISLVLPTAPKGKT